MELAASNKILMLTCNNSHERESGYRVSKHTRD